MTIPELYADKWQTAMYVDPDSEGPFEDGDVKYNRAKDEMEVYFHESWWERGSFLMGRVSRMEEEAQSMEENAKQARQFAEQLVPKKDDG